MPITKNSWIKEIKEAAWNIRKRVLEHTLKNNGGYLCQACSSAEILSTLYLKVLKLGKNEHPIDPPRFSGVPTKNKKNYFNGSIYNGPKKSEFDRFILSPSQYSLVLYAVLIETGRVTQNGLLKFNQDGYTVEMIGADHSPGIELMSGSLGQGLSQAAGIAMARKLKNEKGRVVVFMSDGEFQTGMTWETLQTLAFYKLDNIIIYVDVNCEHRVLCSVLSHNDLTDEIRLFLKQRGIHHD